jgi:hypothetical protein
VVKYGTAQEAKIASPVLTESFTVVSRSEDEDQDTSKLGDDQGMMRQQELIGYSTRMLCHSRSRSVMLCRMSLFFWSVGSKPNDTRAAEAFQVVRLWLVFPVVNQMLPGKMPRRKCRYAR